jgi:hypothetical protein
MNAKDYRLLAHIDETLEELLEVGREILKNQLNPPAPGPGPAAKFHLTLKQQGDNTMAGKATAVNSLDITILPDGTATASIVFEDANGNPTKNVPAGVAMPVYVASDAVPGPSVLVLTPAADGLSCTAKVTLPTPPPSPLPVGLTISATIASGLDGQTAPETENTQGMDVTPAPPGVAAKLALALSEP